jgi:protein gp37
MSTVSAIEWTDATWNPTTGCTKVSPACANCYIERTPPFRVRGRKFVKGDIPIELHPDRLSTPLKRQKPTTYFVNSLSDLFHENIPNEFLDRVFAVMALTPQHRYQVLTKRPERMLAYLSQHDIGLRWLVRLNVGSERRQDKWAYQEADAVRWTREGLPNVWLGVSVENQHFANERIPLLLKTPAAVRFLSCEPLLGPLTFRWAMWDSWNDVNGERRPNVNHLDGLRMLDWIIVGGESGPNVRPTQPDWIRNVRDQCVEAGVAFFFKQWGGKTAKSGGRILDGRTWDEMPSK